jgi:hypothetical protein
VENKITKPAMCETKYHKCLKTSNVTDVVIILLIIITNNNKYT